MAIFKCKMCGGTIEFNQGDTVGISRFLRNEADSSAP